MESQAVRFTVFFPIKGLIIFNPAVGGWSRGEGVKKFLDLLEGGLKNKLLLKGVEKYLSCLIIRESFTLREVKKFHLSCEGGQKEFSGSVRGF